MLLPLPDPFGYFIEVDDYHFRTMDNRYACYREELANGSTRWIGVTGTPDSLPATGWIEGTREELGHNFHAAYAWMARRTPADATTY